MELINVYYFNQSPDDQQWELITKTLERLYPGIAWAGGQPLGRRLGRNLRVLFIRHDGDRYLLKYTNFIRIPQGKDISELVKDTYGFTSENGINLIFPDYSETEDIFNQLNESKFQHRPKLNLRFDPPIKSIKGLDRVLKVLTLVYPGLKWASGQPLEDGRSRHIFQDDSEIEYEPIWYLTIGYYSHKPNALTYTPDNVDDSYLSDDDHSRFGWVDGWQWVEANDVNYDESMDTFFEPL